MEPSPLPPVPMQMPPSFRWLLLILGIASAATGCLRVWFAEVTYLGSFAWVGIGLIVLSLLAPRLPSTMLLFLSASCLGLLLGCLVFAFFRLDPLLAARNLYLTLAAPKVGIWRFDPRYGFSHLPGSSGVHETPSYRVTYHIDAEGCRVTPDPVDPQGMVLCLGCSFTFGTGVEDDQAYPAQLALRDWPRYKVRNAAVAAWGTAHAYLVLQDAMEKPVTPALVTYGWMAAHLSRNWIRKGWILDLQRKPVSFGGSSNPLEWRQQPHFEIEAGRLVFRGVVGPGDAPPESPTDLAREIALTQRLVTEMAALCHARDIPFVLVCLPTDEGDASLPDYLTEAVRESGTWLVDASGARRGFLAEDFHPNAATHAAIADAIAGDVRISEWLGR